ncbi:hypothetical protein GOV14_02445 [Candidatus Pacearchaeota archaeon]|nr:hypothetical protein [Candidatus Pacearchaeota archaeon]
MVLDSKTMGEICKFVKLKPRTVQEISILLKKNWRTAERYIEKISEETGCIKTRIFRGGTRGALKIVYWNMLDDIHSTSFQEELLEEIMKGKRRSDFSPFDIYQYIEDEKKQAHIEDATMIDTDIEISKQQDLITALRNAQKQILIFSGNLSWINSHQQGTPIINIIKEIAMRKIPIKIIARVSIVGAQNVDRLLSINKEVGRDIIEIRHRYQPLRAIVIDNKVVKMRELREPIFYRYGELKKKVEVFYDIYDPEWAEWLQKVFWKMYTKALPAPKRIKEIEKIQNKILLS